MVFLKEFFEKVDFEKKNQQTTKKLAKLPNRQRVKNDYINPYHVKSSYIFCFENIVDPDKDGYLEAS